MQVGSLVQGLACNLGLAKQFVELVIADGQHLDGAYEVWSARGMISFRRFLAEGGGFGYEVIEQLGETIANQGRRPSPLAEKSGAPASRRP
jgi:hypothetical protein